MTDTPEATGLADVSSAAFHQRRGRLPDLVEEVLQHYADFMKDDNYDAWGCLRHVIARLETARDFYDATLPTPQGSTASGEGDVEAKWGDVDTVGNMIAQLRTFDPAATIQAGYHVTMNDGSIRSKVRGLHISRERVVGSNIVQDDVPLSLVAWAGEPLAAMPARTSVDGDLLAALERIGDLDRGRKDSGWATYQDGYAAGLIEAAEIARTAIAKAEQQRAGEGEV